MKEVLVVQVVASRNDNMAGATVRTAAKVPS